MTKTEEIMQKKAITGTEDEKLSKIVAKMDKHDIKEIPILKDGKIKGIVTYYDILDIYAPKNVKAKTIMARPTSIEVNTSIEEVINRMAVSGFEALPVVEKGKLVGIVSEYDIFKYLIKTEELEKYRLKDFLIEVPILRQTDLLSKARVLMRKNKVSRLPVVDKKGKSIGLLLLIDILRKGYKKVSKRERRPYQASYKKFLENSVSNLMRDVPKVQEDEKLENVIRLLLEENLKGISILNEEKEPVGIFSRVHLFNRIAEKYKREVLRVTITGMELDWEIEKGIKNLVEDYGRKLTYFTKINHLKIYLKGIHEAEGKRKIEVELEAQTPGFGIRAKEDGFDIMYTVKRGLEKLESRLRNEFYERGPGQKGE